MGSLSSGELNRMVQITILERSLRLPAKHSRVLHRPLAHHCRQGHPPLSCLHPRRSSSRLHSPTHRQTAAQDLQPCHRASLPHQLSATSTDPPVSGPRGPISQCFGEVCLGRGKGRRSAPRPRRPDPIAIPRRLVHHPEHQPPIRDQGPQIRGEQPVNAGQHQGGQEELHPGPRHESR
jgi:hypothetical protein